MATYVRCGTLFTGNEDTGPACQGAAADASQSGTTVSPGQRAVFRAQRRTNASGKGAFSASGETITDAASGQTNFANATQERGSAAGKSHSAAR